MVFQRREFCPSFGLLLVYSKFESSLISERNIQTVLASGNLETSLVAQTVKRLSTMWETWVQSLGREVPWRRKWQPTPVLLPRKSHGQWSLVSMGLQSQIRLSNFTFTLYQNGVETHPLSVFYVIYGLGVMFQNIAYFLSNFRVLQVCSYCFGYRMLYLFKNWLALVLNIL